jgi:hypothetical protein
MYLIFSFDGARIPKKCLSRFISMRKKMKVYRYVARSDEFYIYNYNSRNEVVIILLSLGGFFLPFLSFFLSLLFMFFLSFFFLFL